MDWEYALSPHMREAKLDLYIYDRNPAHPVLDCSLGTNPLGAPHAALRALASPKTVELLASYPTAPDEFILAISEFWKGRVHPEEILPGAGTMEILFNLLRLFGRPGNVILGLSPQFPDVPQRFRLTGAEFRTVGLGGPAYRLEPAPLIGALTEEVNLAYLDHPHNPTGQAWNLEDLSAIARKCEETGALLIVDEAYGASLPEERSAVMLNNPSVIVLRSFSKIWGLAGLRAGYLVSRCSRFRGYFKKAALPVALSGPALQVVPAVIRERSHLERTRNCFRDVKGKLLREIRNTPGVNFAATDPETPIFFVEPDASGTDLFGKLLNAGILTERGSCYEGVSKGSARIRIPGPDDVNLFLELWKKAFPG